MYARLKSILEPYRRRMHVTTAVPGVYGLDMAPEAERNPTTWFAGVRKGKAYVSYYLMPVAVEDELFQELAELTRRGFERTTGDPSWGVAKREEHGMAQRKAMSKPRGRKAPAD